MIENGWWSGAKALPSPNFNLRPHVEIDAVVVHNISLPPSAFGSGHVQRFFQNCLDYDEHPYFDGLRDLKVSAHIFIERDGSPFQFVSFNDRAWHAGVSEFAGRTNWNDFSIGIELEGTDDAPFSDAQYTCLVELMGEIMNTYPAVVKERIVGHSDIAPDRKTDPGPYFDWHRFKRDLKSNKP